ncbi:hypothetical protein HPB50_005119 [Hyalomma asiaticum]|uniref:Uncharacterized protein n=1 Tax=Hyalomma asiaticum TaxID=266040 RepID=A0ACB7TCA4_HYAAI|nr:hypothetical protein HPB50_005119 [Hyalomma asiaticum]
MRALHHMSTRFRYTATVVAAQRKSTNSRTWAAKTTGRQQPPAVHDNNERPTTPRRQSNGRETLSVVVRGPDKLGGPRTPVSPLLSGCPHWRPTGTCGAILQQHHRRRTAQLIPEGNRKIQRATCHGYTLQLVTRKD